MTSEQLPLAHSAHAQQLVLCIFIRIFILMILFNVCLQ